LIEEMDAAGTIIALAEIRGSAWTFALTPVE
jgi:hypothetical protein